MSKKPSNKLKIRRSKTITIALTLMLTMTALVVGTNLIKAQTTTYQTAAFLSVMPDPVQVKQQVFISFWIQPYSPGIGQLVYHGLTVTITDPTGHAETKGPYAGNPNAGGYFAYVPTKVGNYSVQFKYPGETYASLNKTYEASETPIVQFSVQEEPVRYTSGPGTPLPTDYWTRPISAEMREWSSISGNWLMGGYDIAGHIREGGVGYNPYTTAPKSAHIMWTLPAGGIGQIGGLVGGELGDKSYFTGMPYRHPVYPPIVLEGKLFYNLHESSSGSLGPYGGFVCVDLRTGEELWRNSTATIDVAQTWYCPGIDEIGAYAFLWSTSGNTWTAYDPASGDVMFTFANATAAGTNAYTFGEDGTLFAYKLYNARVGQGPTLLKWNASKAFYGNGLATTKAETSQTGESVNVISGFIPRPGVFDWRKGIEWNITEPVLPGGDKQAITPSLGFTYAFLRGADDVILGRVGNSYAAEQTHVGYSAVDGSQLWVYERFIEGTGARGLAGSGIYAVHDTVQRAWIAYSIKTGQQLWTTEPMKFPWGAYTSYSGITAYGLAYALGYDGYAYAYDIENGQTVWEYYTGDDIYGDTPYGQYPVFGGPMVGGEVIFFGNGEHSPNMPLYRGEKLFANDAKTGDPLWNITGWLDPKAIADGYLVTFNNYDNQIYTFGKGPSATTVEAPMTAIQVGQSCTMTGTVLDMSPGKPHTPAISDEDMSIWMEYLWMQRPMPADAKGVTVKLSAVGSNGNSVDLGEATSDMAGNFGFTWTPDTPGTYKIVVNFDGSESYGSSYATTYMTVVSGSGATASPAPTETPTLAPVETSTPAPTTAAPEPKGGDQTAIYVAVVAVAIIIAVIAAAIILKKRK